MARSSNQISDEEVKKALLNSGYLLENRLENILRNKGYVVEANQFYPDPDTEKSREVDITALKAFGLDAKFEKVIFLKLIIECVNNNQPLAFITKEHQPGSNFLYPDEIKFAGMPTEVPGSHLMDSWKSIPEFFEMHKYHHYYNNRIATQFCTFTKKKKEPDKGKWVASHLEDHYQTFRKLCWVIDYLVDEQTERVEDMKQNKLNLEFYYPLFVIQNKLLDIRQMGHTVKVLDNRHIGFKIAKFDYGEETNYQIDVVTEDFFLDYLSLIEKEMSTIASDLNSSYSVIKGAIKKKIRAKKIKKIMQRLSNRSETFELIE